MAVVRIGSLSRARIVLDVRKRAHPGFDDYWDGNWLTVDSRFEVGAWRATFGMELRVDEFEWFLDGVRRLHEDLRGPAEFQSMETWLSLKLTGDGLGWVQVVGEATDAPGYGDALSFNFKMDQTFLAPLIEDLEGVLAEFPIVGERPTPRN